MASETTANTTEHAVGMPQLDIGTFSNQIFWLVITLVIIYFVLSRIALPRIASVLSDRQMTISSDIAKAEELKPQNIEEIPIIINIITINDDRLHLSLNQPNGIAPNPISKAPTDHNLINSSYDKFHSTSIDKIITK